MGVCFKVIDLKLAQFLLDLPFFDVQGSPIITVNHDWNEPLKAKLSILPSSFKTQFQSTSEKWILHWPSFSSQWRPWFTNNTKQVQMEQIQKRFAFFHHAWSYSYFFSDSICKYFHWPSNAFRHS